MHLPKYFMEPSAQVPIMSTDNLTVIGWDLSVKLSHDGHVVEHHAHYHMSEEHWFPFAEVSARVAESTMRGHMALNTFAEAEAKMDALVAGNE